MLGEKEKPKNFKQLKFYDDYFEPKTRDPFKIMGGPREHKMTDITEGYIKGFFIKCLENMASAKMWLFLLPFIASTGIMGFYAYQALDIIKTTMAAGGIDPAEMSGIISQLKIVGDIFIAWCTFNVSLTTVIIGVREIFKVKKLKALTEPKGAPLTNTVAKEIAKISN